MALASVSCILPWVHFDNSFTQRWLDSRSDGTNSNYLQPGLEDISVTFYYWDEH